MWSQFRSSSWTCPSSKEMNSIYKGYFKTPFPSRTTVEVGKLSLGARIEIAAITHK